MQYKYCVFFSYLFIEASEKLSPYILNCFIFCEVLQSLNYVSF